MDERHNRLFQTLPAAFRASDTAGDLRRLLDAFDAMLFGRRDPGRPGIEMEVDAIPRYFAPLPPEPGNESMMCPDRFLPWLAQWVAFTPHALFSPPQLRRIVAGIVPLYTRRGTRAYLEQLLRLCFEEIDAVEIDEAAGPGLRLGHARVGEDSVLGPGRPFWFRVVLVLRAGEARAGAFEDRVRALIDFAKPAHTAYELMFKAGGPASSMDQNPSAGEDLASKESEQWKTEY
jgi:phage tail-like protein